MLIKRHFFLQITNILFVYTTIKEIDANAHVFITFSTIHSIMVQSGGICENIIVFGTQTRFLTRSSQQLTPLHMSKSFLHTLDCHCIAHPQPLWVSSSHVFQPHFHREEAEHPIPHYPAPTPKNPLT